MFSSGALASPVGAWLTLLRRDRFNLNRLCAVLFWIGWGIWENNAFINRLYEVDFCIVTGTLPRSYSWIANTMKRDFCMHQSGVFKINIFKGKLMFISYLKQSDWLIYRASSFCFYLRLLNVFCARAVWFDAVSIQTVQLCVPLCEVTKTDLTGIRVEV